MSSSNLKEAKILQAFISGLLINTCWNLNIFTKLLMEKITFKGHKKKLRISSMKRTKKTKRSLSILPVYGIYLVVKFLFLMPQNKLKINSLLTE